MKQIVQFFPTRKAAYAVIGSLSDTSKMPGKSWGISASLCNTGAKLAKIPGTVCSDCYAMKGFYAMMPSVKLAHTTRLEAWRADRLAWCQAMVQLITGQETMRWFDSGDLQSAEMLRDILAVVARTPGTKHWIATREVGIVRDVLASGIPLPDNVVIRMSASFPDDLRIPGLELTGNGALVHSSAPATDSAYSCPAPSNGGKCGDCRACWSRTVKLVSYHSH
jgi:hypothetical protein